MTFSRIFLYWNTIRYLKARQILARLLRVLPKTVSTNVVTPRVSKPIHGWVISIRKSGISEDGDWFTFLNESYSLSEIGWDKPAIPKLWRYNLHYFDCLRQEKSIRNSDWDASILERWKEENPPYRGTGWEPYPTSLRIVNFAKWKLEGAEPSEQLLRNIFLQARWLSKNIEYHILGNHLFANAKALLFAGVLFDAPEATKWRQKALGILEKELEEQFLPDGGHFERSPMYHALGVEDLLDILNLVQAFQLQDGDRLAKELSSIIPRTLAFLAGMTHPDGGISFFNDAALGIAPSLKELEVYSQGLGVSLPQSEPQFGLSVFEETGYIRLNANNAVAILDVAPIGPDYLPGHAHADTLSFELSVKEERVIVNSGTSVYQPGLIRESQRTTAAHSTVEIDGYSSSEVWGSFRVAKRAYPKYLKKKVGSGEIVVECSHNGYLRLSGRPIPTRSWTWRHSGITIEDSIEGSFGTALARYYFSPDVSKIKREANRYLVRLKSGNVIDIHVEIGDSSIAEAMYFPEFGVCQPSNCLEVKMVDGKSHVRFEW